MPTPNVARFQDFPCSVVVGNNYDTSGAGTITRSNVAFLTPNQLSSLFLPGGQFADMRAWFQTQLEMKACGTKINGWWEWLMSSRTDVKSLLSVQHMQKGRSLLFPFIMGRQDSVINIDEYWAIIGGVAQSGYTGGAPGTGSGTMSTGPIAVADVALGQAGDRIIRVVNRYGVDLNTEWFLSHDQLYIFDVSTGQTRIGQWRVLASGVDTSNTYIDVLIVNQNNGSPTPYNPTPTGNAVVIAGSNNVSDYESLCQNRPTLDPRKRVPFWFQTMRRGRSINDEYKKVFAALMESNEYFQNFGDLPIAERNRQDEFMYQRRQVNSMMFGKRISGNQTLGNWQNLESIVTGVGNVLDPGLGGELVAKRANMIGIFEQLVGCGQWQDLQNQALNLYDWLNINYTLLRARKSQGRRVEVMDWYTDQVYAAQIETGFVNYFKQEYGDIVRINIEAGENEVLGFSWKIYQPKFPNVKIAIVTAEFFDDLVSNFTNEGVGSAGRLLLCLDIGKPGPQGGTIYPGMITSNKKMRTLGDLNLLSQVDKQFACTMEYTTQDITLTSETMTMIVECPQCSLWVSGLASAVPTTPTTGADQPPGTYPPSVYLY